MEINYEGKQTVNVLHAAIGTQLGLVGFSYLIAMLYYMVLSEVLTATKLQ